MFCPECGNKLSDDALFCAECGMRIEADAAPPLTEGADASAYNSAPVTEAPPREPMSEETKLKLKFSFVLLLIYTAVSLVFILMLGAKDAVVIKAEHISTAGSVEYSQGLSLYEVANMMISGNSIYNPTVLSSAVGVAIYVFFIAVPVMAFVALVATYFGKRFYSLHILSSVISFIAAAIMGAAIPVSLALVPDFNDTLVSGSGVLMNDVQSIEYTKLIIFAAIAAVCVIASMVVTVMFNKRRAQYEQ